MIAAIDIWWTNVIIFVLWYWQLDRNGPEKRSAGIECRPDFLLPQMTAAGLESARWQPSFLDYLYVSFTNATAFSPTDAMPLSVRAKMLMLVQAGGSLLTLILVAARAVNVLK